MPRIQHKRGTSANLASVNPTPLAGELVWDSTENAVKIGDGSTAWTSLAYVTATPRTHTHSGDDITSGTVAYARLPVGSTASTVCAGDDARLTDARSPTAHKSSHATGGSDALTPSDIGAAPAASPEFTGVMTVAPSGPWSLGYLTTTGDGLKISNANTVDGIGNYGAGISWTRNATANNRNAGISSVQTSNDPDQTGLAFFVHGSTTASADMVEAARLTHARFFGIGTPSPASALDVNGVITVSATSGSAGSYLPSVTFSGDSNTGLGQVGGADSVSLITAGSERVRVKSSGTSEFLSPAANAIAVQIRARADNIGAIQFLDYAGSGQGILAQNPGNLNLRAPADGQVTLATNGLATILCAKSTAATNNERRVGINTNDPGSTLHVNGVITVSATSGSAGSYLPSVTFSGDSNTGLGQVGGADSVSLITAGSERVRVDSLGRLFVYANGAERMRVDASGRVGIATDGPTAILDVNSNIIRLRTAKTPASASDTGNAGDICWDASYLYICTATNTWRKARLSADGQTFTGTTTFNGPVVEGRVVGGNTGTAKTIALTNGTLQDYTLTGNCTFTMPTATAGQSFTLMLRTGDGSYTATFTGVKWPGSTPVATTTASRMDLFTFVSDGTNWYGNVVQGYTP